ncbi:Maturin Maturin neural progenitor differentiation regulator protein -like protein [Takifugu flavidus]|uniref:Maturin n=1 Tax=Takifugu flavidus TaxID=433684 RepID=A0A5C6ND07_9TELE|nr:Maturin Maturin neural progenitor differentiation regulator protein -like protein [Takifugu flavidus]
MEFKNLVEAAEEWCSGNPFDLIFAEEDDERRMDFYAEPGVSFYVLCPGGTDNFHVWSESEDCLPFLQLAQDYISSCGKKTLLEVLEKVFTSFRPVGNWDPGGNAYLLLPSQLLGLPELEDDSFGHYHADMEGEPGPDHQQMGVSQQ